MARRVRYKLKNDDMKTITIGKEKYLDRWDRVTNSDENQKTFTGRKVKTISNEPMNRNPYSRWTDIDIYKTNKEKILVDISEHALWNSIDLHSSYIKEFNTKKDAKEYITHFLGKENDSDLIPEVSGYFSGKKR